MELQTVKPRNNISTNTTKSLIISPEQDNNMCNKHFIESNTKSVNLKHLEADCVIPNFSKDNESTISHQEFINSIMHCAKMFYSKHQINQAKIRVSHEIKGRIPQAIGKPAKDLLEHEKTIYYERMAFVIEIPTIIETINGNKLMLCIGGVRAYNQENLYSKKTIEKFKIFIGFQNLVCTNLCISTDGFIAELRVSHKSELIQKTLELFQNYNMEKQLHTMVNLNNFKITEHQFAQLIGRIKLYYHLPLQEKKTIPSLDFNDSQVNVVVKDYYYDKSFCKEENGNINLWNMYNLFTGANKSSYIDTFLDRNVNAYQFTDGISKALQGQGNYHWFLS